MARDIQPLTLGDLPELSRFLTAGFHTQPEADFAAPEVLRWKYLEPMAAITTTVGSLDDGSDNQPNHHADQDSYTAADASTAAPRSYIARDKSGLLIGHVGFCRTFFEGQAITASGGRVPTIHIIDWLGSPEYRPLGVSLGRKVQQGVATQFMLGAGRIGKWSGSGTAINCGVSYRFTHASSTLRTGFGPAV